MDFQKDYVMQFKHVGLLPLALWNNYVDMSKVTDTNHTGHNLMILKVDAGYNDRIGLVDMTPLSQ